MQFVNVDEVSSELKCSICLLPWTDPLQTPCEHIFCGKCLLPHLQTTKNCPDCRHPIPNTKELTKIARPLLSMSNRVQVYCLNKSRGCPWVGERGNFADHDNSCEFRAPPEEVDERAPSAPAAATDVLLQTVNEFPVVEASKAQKVLTMAHIVAPTKQEVEKRKPIHVSAVIDVSGSMSDKIELVRQTMRFVVQEMCGEDELGIIAFDDRVEERLKLIKMDQDGKAQALCAIENLRHRGSTNLSGGLFAGMDQVRGLALSGDGSDDDMSWPRNSRSSYRAPPPQVTQTQKPSLLSRVHAALSSSFGGSSSTTANAVHVDPTVFPLGSTVAAKVTIKHDTTVFKRDGKTVYRYKIDISVDPQNAVVATKIGSDSCTTKTLESSVKMPSINVTVDFLPEFKQHPLVINYSLDDEDGSVTQTQTLSNGPAPAPPVDKKTKDLETPVTANISAVWLFTDGQANAGITEPGELVSATKARLSSHTKDISVFTFGFGESHNAALLQSIAEASQGSYYFIKNTDTIKESFADCLGGLLSVVAQNIRLELILQGSVTLDRLMTKFPTETKAGGIIEVTMKDLYSDEQRDVLVSLNLPAAAASSSYRLAVWRLTYLNLMTGAIKTQEFPANITVATTVPPGQVVDTELDKQRNRILVTEAMEEAKKQAEAGRMKEAQAALATASACVGATTTSSDAYCMALQDDMLQLQNCMTTQSQYMSSGSKMMAQKYSSHAQQRCNDSSAGAMYETKEKRSAKSKAKSFF